VAAPSKLALTLAVAAGPDHVSTYVQCRHPLCLGGAGNHYLLLYGLATTFRSPCCKHQHSAGSQCSTASPQAYCRAVQVTACHLCWWQEQRAALKTSSAQCARAAHTSAPAAPRARQPAGTAGERGCRRGRREQGGHASRAAMGAP